MRGVKRKAKRDSSTAPANFFVGTKKEEKIGRLRSCLRQAGGMTTTRGVAFMSRLKPRPTGRRRKRKRAAARLAFLNVLCHGPPEAGRQVESATYQRQEGKQVPPLRVRDDTWLIFVVVFVRTVARDCELVRDFPVMAIFLGVFGAIFHKAFEGTLRMLVHRANRSDQARI
jgi:hypothetical protein